MRPLLLVGFAILSLAYASPSLAESDLKSGNYMLRACQVNAEVRDFSLCMGRLDGLRAGAFFGEVYGAIDLICYPTDVTLGQQADVLLAYLRAHPERRDRAWYFLALHALSNAWPCKNGASLVWDEDLRLPTLVPKP